MVMFMKAVTNPLFSISWGTAPDTPDDLMTPVLSVCLKKRSYSTTSTEVDAHTDGSDAWNKYSLRWTSSDPEQGNNSEACTPVHPLPPESSTINCSESKPVSLVDLHFKLKDVSAATEEHLEGGLSGVTQGTTACSNPCEPPLAVPSLHNTTQSSSDKLAVFSSPDAGSLESTHLNRDQGGSQQPPRWLGTTPEFDFYSTGGTDLWATLQLTDHLNSAQWLNTVNSALPESRDINQSRLGEETGVEEEVSEQARPAPELVNHVCEGNLNNAASSGENVSAISLSSSKNPPHSSLLLPQSRSMSELGIEVEFSEQENNIKDCHSAISTDYGGSVQGTEGGNSGLNDTHSVGRRSQGAQSSFEIGQWDVQDERTKFMRMREASRVCS